MRITVIILFLFSLTGFAQKSEQWSRVKLGTQITLDHYNYFPWRNCISNEAKDNFLGPLLKLVDDGIIKVYHPKAPYNLAMSKKEVMAVLHSADTILSPDINTGLFDTVIVPTTVRPYHIYSLLFREVWELEPISHKFVKQVKGIVLEKEIYNHYTGKYFDAQPLFYVSFDMSSVKDPEKLRKSPLQLNYSTEQLFNRYNPAGNSANEDEKVFSIATLFVNPYTTFLDTIFPYTDNLPKDRRDFILNNKQYISTYHFSETWTIDLGTFTFKKEVAGILYSTKNGSAIRSLVYVPLNKRKPQPVLHSDRAYLEVFYMQTLSFEHDSSASYKRFNPVTANEDSVALGRFTKEVAEKAFQQKIAAYFPEDACQTFINLTDPEPQKMDAKMINEVFIQRDSAMVQVITPTSEDFELHIIERKLVEQYVTGLVFLERWGLDPVAGTFTKRIQAFGNVYGHPEDGSGTTYIYKYPFLVLNGPGEPGTPQLLSKNVRYQSPINFMNDYPFEDTVLVAELWDANHHNLNTLHRYTIVQGLIDACVEGKLVCSDPKTGKILKKKEILLHLQTFLNSTTQKGHLSNEFRPVNYLEFEENWYRHEGTTGFSKEVLSVVLISKTKRETELGMIDTDEKLLSIQFKTKKK